MKALNEDIVRAGMERYRTASGWGDLKRNSDGYMVLTPSASNIDREDEEVTTNISALKVKLAEMAERKKAVEKAKKSDEYKSSKKNTSKKKLRKANQTLLDNIFNNADHLAQSEEDDEDDQDEYTDIKPKKTRTRKPKDTTLDTTTGKRFAPMIAMYRELGNEFDGIAQLIQDELENSSQGRTRGNYRSTQITNLISAKGNKMATIDKITNIAKTISDYEYKREKDAATAAAKVKDNDDGNNNAQFASFAGKFLRGSFDDTHSDIKESKQKKRDKKKNKKNKSDDDDDDYGTVESRKVRSEANNELTAELLDVINKQKRDIKFTAHEQHIHLEGTYEIQVLIKDRLNPTRDDWKFVAIDKKSGKIIDGFKDDYPGLMPKKKNCKMSFDVGKERATDRNMGKTYRMICER